MDKDIGIVTTPEWKRPTVYHRMTLIQNHISWIHCDIDRIALMIVNFQWPRFVHILCNVDNRGRHQWKSIHVWAQNGTGRVDADPVHGGWTNLDTRPMLHGRFGRFPYSLFESPPGTPEFGIFHVHHVRRSRPVIRVDIPNRPIFKFFLVLIHIPMFLEESRNIHRSTYLDEACRCIILTRGKSQTGEGGVSEEHESAHNIRQWCALRFPFCGGFAGKIHTLTTMDCG
mmetsp:Transcript_11760/g.27237  ORF Transcript_11760/g.27237 Transcript_11760/m.27237 type:complete len:228 (-) Transcript_11760:274-957(-)